MEWWPNVSKVNFKNGLTSNKLRVFIPDTTSVLGGGKTGLTFSSAGLIISTIADNEATATTYTQAGSTIETISTLGTFAAPTATKCRFKEVDATNLPGVYEIQIADARFAVSSARSLIVSLPAVSGLGTGPIRAEIQLEAVDNQDATAFGVSRIDAAISSRSTYAGGDTSGTTTLLSRIGSALTITSGKVDVNDKTGFSLSSGGVQAIWDALTSALTTSGSIGKLIVDNLNATISSVFNRIGAPAGASVSADVAAIKSDTGTSLTNETTLLSRLSALRAGYLDNLNVGGNVASSAEATAIQNNTRVVRVVPSVFERPDSGSTAFRIELFIYDEVGNMEAPDSAPTLGVVNQSGTSRDANLDSTTMTLVSTGRYRSTYTIDTVHALEELLFTFSVVEGGATRLYGNGAQVADTTAVDFTATDRTNLGAIKTQTDLLAFTSGKVNAQVKAIDTDAITAAAIASDAVTEVQSGLATASALTIAQADLDDIQTRLPVALVGGRMDSNVQAMANDVLTAAAIATDAIGSNELAASGVTKIQTGLGTSSAVAAVQTSIDTVAGYVDTEVAAIKAKTDQMVFTNVGKLDAQVRGMDTDVLSAAAVAAAAVTKITSGLATLASIGALHNLSASDVNAEMVDVMSTDTHAQPTAPPSFPMTYQALMMYIAAQAINPIIVDKNAGTQTLRNNADSADIAVQEVSDDGDTFRREAAV